MKYIVTGGTGKLGSELKKFMDGYYPTRRELDVRTGLPHTKDHIMPKDYDVFIHCAAFTESDPFNLYRTNVVGTFNMAYIFHELPFVLFCPRYQNDIYGHTKLISDMVVSDLCPRNLIIKSNLSSRRTARLSSEIIKSWDFNSRIVVLA